MKTYDCLSSENVITFDPNGGRIRCETDVTSKFSQLSNSLLRLGALCLLWPMFNMAQHKICFTMNYKASSFTRRFLTPGLIWCISSMKSVAWQREPSCSIQPSCYLYWGFKQRMLQICVYVLYLRAISVMWYDIWQHIIESVSLLIQPDTHCFNLIVATICFIFLTDGVKASVILEQNPLWKCCGMFQCVVLWLGGFCANHCP